MLDVFLVVLLLIATFLIVKLLGFHIGLKLKGMTTYEYILQNLNKVRPLRKERAEKQILQGTGNPSILEAGVRNQDDSREELSRSDRDRAGSVNLRYPTLAAAMNREHRLEVSPVKEDMDQTHQEASKTNLKESARPDNLPIKPDSKRSMIAQADKKPVLARKPSHNFTEEMSHDEKIESLKNLSFLQMQKAFMTYETDECRNDNQHSVAGLGHEMLNSKVTNAEMDTSSLKQSKSEGDLTRLGERQTSRGGMKTPINLSPDSRSRKVSMTYQQSPSLQTGTKIAVLSKQTEAPRESPH